MFSWNRSCQPNCFYCNRCACRTLIGVMEFMFVPHLKETLCCSLRYLTECMGLKDEKETLSKMYDSMRRKDSHGFLEIVFRPTCKHI